MKCWEIEECGREPGGKNAIKLGVCPVAVEAIRQDEYLEVAEVMIAVINREGIIVFMNRKGYEILGYERGELMGKSWFELLVPKDIRDRMYKMFQEIIAGKIILPEYYENELVRKDGKRRLIYFHNSVINTDGSISGILLSAEDITDRRKIENKLIEDEKRLNAAISSSLDAMIMVNCYGRIELWNQAAEKLFGYSKKEAIGKLFLDTIIPIRYRLKANKNFSEFVKTGQSKLIGKITEIEALRKDGSLFPVELSISSVMLKKQRYAFAIIHDISKRKAFQKKIRDSEEKFRLLSEKSLAGVYIIQDGLFRYVNPAFGRMFGYQVSDIIDKLGPFDLSIPEDRAWIKKDLSNRLLGKVKTVHHYFRYSNKDGKILEFEVLGSATHYRGRPAVIGTILDVTEQKKKERELQQKNFRAEKSVAQFKQLVYLDELTKIYNRRMFNKIFNSEWSRAKRNESSIAFIMIDIDLFKGYNDNYGHVAGDKCLIKIAKVLKDSLFRSTDCAARYGGEEFAIILPNTKLNGALMIANRVKANVQALHIPYSCSPVLKWVTISLGAASIVPHNSLKPNDLIKMADSALYKAKNCGRNRVEFSEARIA